ncbi:MAG: hypothetical protein WCD07_02155 [Burkholderiales bacterium]
MHDNHCIRCHDIWMYQSERRISKDWKSLRAAVSHWQRELKLKWKEADIDDVTAYLNQLFFHFPVSILVCEGDTSCNANANPSSSRVD